MKNITIGCALLAFTALPSSAQDAHAGHGAEAAATILTAELPEICLTAESMSAEPMAMDHKMDEAHTDLMAGMDKNNQLMTQAGMVQDLDVAFVCAMIPHHQSAINMAKAELKHGDNAWAKEMAQKIIDAQESEIADMKDWLASEGTTE